MSQDSSCCSSDDDSHSRRSRNDRRYDCSSDHGINDNWPGTPRNAVIEIAEECHDVHNMQTEVWKGRSNTDVGDKFRLACENEKNYADVLPSFKKYAKLLFDFLHADSSLGACLSREKPFPTLRLVGVYTGEIGKVVSTYLDLKDCVLLSFLIKEFEKAFLKTHLRLYSESWINTHCTFGLENPQDTFTACIYMVMEWNGINIRNNVHAAWCPSISRPTKNNTPRHAIP